MNLQEQSREISERLAILIQELEDQKSNTIMLLEKTTEEFKEASAQGDRSENAAFTEATAKLSMYNITLSMIDTRIWSIKNKVHEERYIPIGIIVTYATVLLRVQDGREFVIKLYPEGVSDVGRGIISIDSPLGIGLWRKEIGDVITLEHKATGELIRYTIIDIY